MNLSELRDGDVGKFVGSGDRFIVVDRIPEDRSSGSTRVTSEGGITLGYIWDYENPLVEKLGRGRLVIQIVLETEGEEQT